MGVHSYIAYLRDRTIASRSLLADSGSLFVQSSDENLHRVRVLLDEIFGLSNFVSQINVQKTSGSTADYIPNSCDYVLWYAKNKNNMRFFRLYLPKEVGAEGATGYTKIEYRNGERRSLTEEQITIPSSIPTDATIFAGDNVTSQSIGREKGEGAASWFAITVDGTRFDPGPKARWKTNEDGVRRLLRAGRLIGGNRTTLSYKRDFDDFSVTPLSNIWTDTVGQNGTVKLTREPSDSCDRSETPWLCGRRGARDVGPDFQSSGPCGSVLGGSDVIAAEMKEVVDLVMSREEPLRLSG